MQGGMYRPHVHPAPSSAQADICCVDALHGRMRCKVSGRGQQATAPFFVCVPCGGVYRESKNERDRERTRRQTRGENRNKRGVNGATYETSSN